MSYIYGYHELGDVEIPPEEAGSSIGRYLSYQHTEAIKTVEGRGQKWYEEKGLRAMLGDKRYEIARATELTTFRNAVAPDAYNAYIKGETALKKEMTEEFRKQTNKYIITGVKNLGDHVFSTMYASFDGVASGVMKKVTDVVSRQVKDAIGSQVSAMVGDMAGQISSVAATLGTIGGPLVGLAVGSLVQGIFTLFRKEAPTPKVELAWVNIYPDPEAYPIIPNIASLVGEGNSMLGIVSNSPTLVPETKSLTKARADAQVLVAYILHEITEHEQEDLVNHYWFARIRQLMSPSEDYTRACWPSLRKVYAVMLRQFFITQMLGEAFETITNNYNQIINIRRSVSGFGNTITFFPEKGQASSYKVQLGDNWKTPSEFIESIGSRDGKSFSAQKMNQLHPYETNNEWAWRWHGLEIYKRYKNAKTQSLRDLAEKKFPPLVLLLESMTPEEHINPMIMYAQAEREFEANVNAVMKARSEYEPRTYGTTQAPAQQKEQKLTKYKFMRTEIKNRAGDVAKVIEKTAPAVEAAKKAQMFKTFAIIGAAAAGGLYLLTKKKK